MRATVAGSKKGHNKGHPPFNTKGEGGRPRKWNGESLEALSESLDKWIDKAVENRDQFWWWDWCFDVGLDQTKVAKLSRESDRFRQSYDRARQWQESIVARHALTKKFSEGFSKFMLVNHYSENWKEKCTPEQNSVTTADLVNLVKDLAEKGKIEQKNNDPIV